MKKNLKFIIPAAVIVLYLCMALFFNNAFLPNTYINDVNYGFRTISDTEYRMKNNAEPEGIELIKNDGLSEMVDLSSLEYDVTITTDLNEILQSQNSFTWIFDLFQKNHYKANVNITYNTDNIDSIINNLKCVTSQKVSEPQDAYIEKTDNGYAIIPETEGSLINKEALKSAILYALNNNETSINLSDENCYVKAKITTEDPSIKEAKNMIDKINSLEITYDFDDRQEILDSTTIAKWITIDGTTISVDEEKAKQYVTNLAYKYDTYGNTRTFVTTSGETIDISGGIFGWKTNIENTTKELIDTIILCESTTIKPDYELYGLSRKVDDIGNTYVEVSIDEQHMWFYKDGQLIMDTDVVTGLTNGKRDTPKGVFCIWSREKERTLGTYATQGYETFVNFWMPIDWTGVGIHDANWRSSFGGNIYKTNGSHGCINTPYDKVQILFENCKTGTPVIIY